MRSFWMTLASSLAADPFASYAGAPALISMSYPAASKGRRFDAERGWAVQDRAAPGRVRIFGPSSGRQESRRAG